MNHPNPHRLIRKLVHARVATEGCSDTALSYRANLNYATTATFQVTSHSSASQSLDIIQYLTPTEQFRTSQMKNCAVSWIAFLSGQSYNPKLSLTTIVEPQK
jgi:hypothetical protein